MKNKSSDLLDQFDAETDEEKMKKKKDEILAAMSSELKGLGPIILKGHLKSVGNILDCSIRMKLAVISSKKILGEE